MIQITKKNNKNIFLALAVLGFVASTQAGTFGDDKKKCDKDKKACCAKKEGKACAGKEEAKAGTTKTEEKKAQ